MPKPIPPFFGKDGPVHPQSALVGQVRTTRTTPIAGRDLAEAHDEVVAAGWSLVPEQPAYPNKYKALYPYRHADGRRATLCTSGAGYELVEYEAGEPDGGSDDAAEPPEAAPAAAEPQPLELDDVAAAVLNVGRPLRALAEYAEESDLDRDAWGEFEGFADHALAALGELGRREVSDPAALRELYRCEGIIAAVHACAMLVASEAEVQIRGHEHVALEPEEYAAAALELVGELLKRAERASGGAGDGEEVRRG